MSEPHLILPVGTQVVTRVQARRLHGEACAAGTLGVITEVPLDGTHSYTVTLPDGSAIRLRRDQLRIHRSSLVQDLESGRETLDFTVMEKWVIYKCVVGSQAYGLARDGSDVDRRGIYLPPSTLHWSLFGVPKQLENDDTQECYWELQKFLGMALKANPNILECLYTPLVECCHPLATELLGMRSIFITKNIYRTYNGYVLSQFKRLEQDVRTTGSLKWKHAMHPIRLLLCGIQALKTGEVPVNVGSNRDRLLGIRDGLESWDGVNQWRLMLHKEFEQAYTETHLPPLPNFARANEFLIKARRYAVDGMEKA